MDVELSIVMPCLDEAPTVGRCVAKARAFLESRGISGEVIVADNGSTDGSPALAEAAGARVVSVVQHGYGAALRSGIEAARGRFVAMGDCDASYDFGTLMPFLERLRAGEDLVVGNRFRGGIQDGAMPFLHRHLGNPALSLLARVFFGTTLGDVYCGLRAFSQDAYRRLDLQGTGMEFALEMVVKASILRLRVGEEPTTLAKDGRDRPPHLHTWRDGRRSLLLYLASMPRGLFFYPGLLAMLVGLLVGARIAVRPIDLGGVHFDVHTLLYCSAAVIVGFQLVAYSVYLRLVMIAERLLPADPGFLRRVKAVKLEYGLLLGAALVVCGAGGTLYLLAFWRGQAYGDLDPFRVMRLAIPAVTLLTLGMQVAAAGLFLSLLKWPWRSRASL